MFKTLSDRYLRENPLEHPVVPLKTNHGGITQITKFSYKVDKNGRRVRVTQNGDMCRTMNMRLPLIFSPEVWSRHDYSLEDVIDTLNYFRSIHLWQLAVTLGVPLSNSSVKLAFSSPTSMVFSSKAIVMVKIATHLRKHYKFPAQSVLDRTHEDHVPPLPVHRIPARTYQMWMGRTPQEKTETSMLTENEVEHLFTWKDILLVPMWMEKDCIYMIRVIDEHTFHASKRDCDSLSTRPIHFRCKGFLFYGLVDEAAFFLPDY
jgi:hypothetical protein